MRKYACHADITLDRKIEPIDDVQLTKAFFDAAELTIARISACPPKRKRTAEGVGKRVSAMKQIQLTQLRQ